MLDSEDNGRESLELGSWNWFSEHVGGHVCCAKMLELNDACFDIVDHEWELVHEVFGAFVIAAEVVWDCDIGKTFSLQNVGLWRWTGKLVQRANVANKKC